LSQFFAPDLEDVGYEGAVSEGAALRTGVKSEEVALVPDGAGAPSPSRVFHFRPASFFLSVSSTFVAEMRDADAAVSMAANRGSMV
jgi:hypothetical protein